MRHAILGPGGVGGLLAGVLSRAAHPVLLLIRPGSLESTPSELEVASAELGSFTVPVRAAVKLHEPVDVVWVCVKAAHLEKAIEQVEPRGLKGPVIIPLMNGIDHIARLREVYGGRVIPGTVQVEATRVAPGRVENPSPTARIGLSPPQGLGARAEVIAEELEAAGFQARLHESEALMLWSKLCFIVPLALCTSAAGAPLSAMRAGSWRERLEASARESCAVARACGAAIEAESVLSSLDELPASSRSSMLRDLEAGLPLELDAIAGAVQRRAREHGLATPAVDALVAMVQERLARR